MLLLGAGIVLQAQTHNPYDKHGLIKKGHAITVHSVNLAGGLYSPEMDYWNDNYLPSAGSDEEFGGSMFFGGNITFGISSEYRARVGVSYWSDKVTGDGSGFDEFKLSFTRVSIGGLYVPDFASFGDFQAYAGIEAYVYDINNKILLGADSGSENQNGQDFSFAPIIGIERLVGDKFLIGAELSYMIGEYNQIEIDATMKNKVSISGPQLTISLGYKF